MDKNDKLHIIAAAAESFIISVAASPRLKPQLTQAFEAGVDFAYNVCGWHDCPAGTRDLPEDCFLVVRGEFYLHGKFAPTIIVCKRHEDKLTVPSGRQVFKSFAPTHYLVIPELY